MTWREFKRGIKVQEVYARGIVIAKATNFILIEWETGRREKISNLLRLHNMKVIN